MWFPVQHAIILEISSEGGKEGWTDDQLFHAADARMRMIRLRGTVI